MGMPKISVVFRELASTANSSRMNPAGIIFTGTAKTLEIADVDSIPNTLGTTEIEQLNLLFKGFSDDYVPSKVYAYWLGDATYTDAVAYMVNKSVEYVCAPTVGTDVKTEDFETAIIAARDDESIIKAVIPNSASDNEGIINFTTASITTDDSTYTAESFCSRIAGILASTPYTMSATYTELSDVNDCTTLTNAEMDTAVEAGEFIILNDGTKVKTGRAVNSLVTLTDTKSSQYTKIRIVAIMDKIKRDIKTTIQDSYLGVVANTYGNKTVLISAIDGYLRGIKANGLLESESVAIDLDANEEYLQSIGTDTTDMTEQAIKSAYTGSNVYLKAAVQLVDTMEDFEILIEC